MGFAIQLCVLRYPGWSINDVEPIPESVIKHVAKQLHVDPQSFSLYSTREATKYEHLEELRNLYGFKNFTLFEYRKASRFLLQHAMSNGNTMYLLNTIHEHLKKNKIIMPGMTTLERLVWETKTRAEEKLFNLLTNSLTNIQLMKLNEVLNGSINGTKTRFSWLKEIPGQSSPDAFLKVIERLEYIRSIKLNVNLDAIHPNKLLQLARLGAKYNSQSLNRFRENKRYAILVAYLSVLSQNLIDQAIEIHDRQMMLLQSKGRKSQEEIQKQNGKSLNEKINHFIDIGVALIKAKEQGLDPFTTLEQVIPWEKMIHSVEEAKQLARPLDFDYIDLIGNRFSYLRKYTPALLNSLEFRSTQASSPLMRALDSLREINDTGKRKLPKDTPMDFLPNRWQKHVCDNEGNINRAYYEIAALNELKNHIRSGDVYVVGSRLHKDFDEYLTSGEEWKKAKVNGHRLAINLSAKEYLDERLDSLSSRLKWVSNNIGTLEGININNSKLHVNRLEKDTPEEARSYSLSLYNMLPRIKLSDLLIEVSGWTGFDEAFVHAATNRVPKGNEKSVLIATLMALGTNIGLTKMAEATPGISYYQMANTAQWRLYDDALIKAQSKLVNFQHKLALSSYWGEGKTSSSDGMRVQVGVSSLHADANPHYGTGKGATLYRFTSDQYSSFYTKVINTNARDAVHVIDGLLHHESDLVIEEHYTDTAGYTDQVFGLSHILGFRFAQRLRDLSDTKLYTISSSGDYPNIESILRGKINTKLIFDNFDDVLRLAHSNREGKVSGSLIMSKLGSYSRQNKLATALREMGRIEKTIYILDYISNEALRRRVQKGLN